MSEQKYEYKFVRLGEGWTTVKRTAYNEYKTVVQQHAEEGWRLVQVLAPSFGVYGAAKYIEVIFEREIAAP